MSEKPYQSGYQAITCTIVPATDKKPKRWRVHDADDITFSSFDDNTFQGFADGSAFQQDAGLYKALEEFLEKHWSDAHSKYTREDFVRGSTQSGYVFVYCPGLKENYE